MKYVYHFCAELLVNGEKRGVFDGITEYGKPIASMDDLIYCKSEIKQLVLDNFGYVPNDVLVSSMSILFWPGLNVQR